MKKFLRGLSILLFLTLIGAVFALRAGWLGLPWAAPPAAPPSPAVDASPSSVAQASPSPTTPPTPSPSPLPRRDPSVLRVAVGTRASALLFLALPQFIREHQQDLDVQCIIEPDATLRWQMLAAGRVDLACGTLDSFVLAAGRNNPGAVLFEVGVSNGFDALVARNATSLPELADKRIAVVGGEGGRRLLSNFLNSVKPSHFTGTIVDTDDARDALQMLRTGRVDGAVLWNPYVDAAQREPGVRVIARTSSAQEQAVEVCVVSQSALSNRKPQVLKFMQYWFDLEHRVLGDRFTGIKMVARCAERKESDVIELLERVQLYTLEDNQKRDPKTVALEIGVLQDFWRETGVPNSNNPVDSARLVQIDLTQQVSTDTHPATTRPISVPNGTTPSSDVEDAPIEIDASGTPLGIVPSSTPDAIEPPSPSEPLSAPSSNAATPRPR